MILAAASRNLPSATRAINSGILTCTGQPVMQGLFLSVQAALCFRPPFQRYSRALPLQSSYYGRPAPAQASDTLLRIHIRHDYDLLLEQIAMPLAALYRRALLCLVHGTAAHCTVKINEVTVETGPSTQANLVSPLTVRRQPPHMPVPSTMMVFMETMVLMPYGRVVSQTNFIMIIGPDGDNGIVLALPASISSLSTCVTRALRPFERHRSRCAGWCRRSSSRPEDDDVLVAETGDQVNLSAHFVQLFACGYAIAQPRPPPTTATFLRPSSSLSCLAERTGQNHAGSRPHSARRAPSSLHRPPGK